jgi:cellulose synthase/poly-beta-1,6-N-acetylglucosamine synthase-like glycosyltransferase
MGVGRSLWGGTPPAPIPERVLDGIPGCAAWLALLFSVASAIAFPRTLLFIAALLGFYSAVRFLLAGIASVRGLRLIRQWEQKDWYTHYLQHATPDAPYWDDVHHIVIIPNYKEPLKILKRTLDNLAGQYEAHRRMTIVLAMEAAEEGCIEKAEALKAQYEPCFAHFFYTVHPRGLPGEMQCKSANQAWAARWIKRKLVDELGANIDHLVVTTMDADTRWHPRYFFALTSLFAVNPKRYLRFWQGPIRYHGNIWEINPLMRLVNAYATAFELAYLAAPWWMPLPMSSYSLSLKLLDTSNYWDADVIADEWHMFIKAYFARNGEVELERVFLPFLADATTGETLWEAIVNRYQQTLRHAWGSKEVGFMLSRMLEHPEVEFAPTFNLLMRISHDILLAGAGWVILTAGSQLPLLLHPTLLQQFAAENITNPTFVLLQSAFLTVSILGVVFWWQDVIVRPERTTAPTRFEPLLTLISFPLLPVLTLIFVALPVMQAQTRLLMGVPLQFRVTKKL